jgi:tyrosine-protein kinase Etk/Wzc
MTLQTSYPIESEAPQESLHTAQLSDHNHEVSLIEVLTQLAYRKRLIAKVTGVAILIGVVLAFALPVRYTATTKLMPPQQTQSASSLMMSQLTAAGGGSLAALAGGSLGLKSPNDIYIGLLTSRLVADSIISRFDLAKEYKSRDMTETRKDLADFTQVTSEKNGFISVSVTDKDKKRVAAMANAYTDELRILTKTLAVTEASQRRLFYEEQLKQAKDALIVAELAFQQVQQDKGLVQLDAQAKAMIEGLAALRAQVAAKQVEVQALRSYSTERNPDLELAERELATLQAEVGRLEQRNHSSGSVEMGLQDVPGAGMEYLRADHEVRYRQALFDLLIKQYDAARLDEAKDAAIIQVVEPAIEPDKRTSPKRGLIVTLFTVAGFLTGCFVVLVLWWRELVKFDPVALRQIEGFRRALTKA